MVRAPKGERERGKAWAANTPTLHHSPISPPLPCHLSPLPRGPLMSDGGSVLLSFHAVLQKGLLTFSDQVLRRQVNAALCTHPQGNCILLTHCTICTILCSKRRNTVSLYDVVYDYVTTDVLYTM